MNIVMKATVLFVLLLLPARHVSAQVIANGYENLSAEGKRLILAPLQAIDHVDGSVAEQYPEIRNPHDSLVNLIEKGLQYKLREFSKIKVLYSSTFKVAPVLKTRNLQTSHSDAFTMLLPADSTIVRMNLLGRVPKEPDFILFLHIGNILYNVSASFSPAGAIFNPRGLGLTINKGIILENVSYAYWDNTLGRIIAYDQKSLITGGALLYGAGIETINETLARFILAKTPFADPNMAY